MSDIHIECPSGKEKSASAFVKTAIQLPAPPAYRSALVARIKIMRLDISERRRAQDNKINFASIRPAIQLREASSHHQQHGRRGDAAVGPPANLPSDQIGLSAGQS